MLLKEKIKTLYYEVTDDIAKLDKGFINCIYEYSGQLRYISNDCNKSIKNLSNLYRIDGHFFDFDNNGIDVNGVDVNAEIYDAFEQVTKKLFELFELLEDTNEIEKKDKEYFIEYINNSYSEIVSSKDINYIEEELNEIGKSEGDIITYFEEVDRLYHVTDGIEEFYDEERECLIECDDFTFANTITFVHGGGDCSGYGVEYRSIHDLLELIKATKELIQEA